MKHIEQTGGHCVVASICMVLDLNYAFYEGRIPAVPSWNALLTLWRGKKARSLASRIGALAEAPAMGRITTKGFRELVGQGRGVMLIDAKHWKTSHVVAFEDGVIYDPAPTFPNGKVLLAEQFLIFCRRRKISVHGVVGL